ncbi:MAG: hypothetical protein QF552_09770 [Litorilituus sp.]|jgi:hypothetical protein|nr:hypothetical protein [Litorilituus sp.]
MASNKESQTASQQALWQVIDPVKLYQSDNTDLFHHNSYLRYIDVMR